VTAAEANPNETMRTEPNETMRTEVSLLLSQIREQEYDWPLSPYIL
jgi:hypothetical protein